VGAALLVAGQGPVAITLATAVAGLSMSSIFPLVVSQYADRAGAGAQSGLLFAASGLGGAAIPPMVGIIADASGSLRTGISMLLATLAAMFVLELRLSR
jgi:fucose permease